MAVLLRSKPGGGAASLRPEPPEPREAGPTPAALKSRALRWLAQRDHGRAELERKLVTHARALARLAEQATAASGAEPEFGTFEEPELRRRVTLVLDQLAAAGLLNEARMAEALLNARAPRFGERRLRQTLQQRGLEPALVDASLSSVRETELERARALWLRRFDAPGATAAERMRQMRFLAGRGFSTDVIRRVVKGLADDEGLAPSDDPA